MSLIRRTVIRALTSLLAPVVCLVPYTQAPAANGQALSLSTPNTTFSFSGSSINISGFGLGIQQGPIQTDYGRYGVFQDRLFELYHRLENYKQESALLRVSNDPDWLHWWELRRHHYLPPFPQQLQDPEASKPKLDAFLRARSAAQAPVLQALGDDNADIRWVGAINAGRLRIHAAVPTLIELTQDQDVRVNTAAWAALGLIDSQTSRAALLEPVLPEGVEQLNDFQQAGRVAGLGFVEETTPAIEQLLTATASGPWADATRRAAMSSLRKLNPQQAARVGHYLINNFADYGAVDEALVALGDANQQTYEPIAKLLTQRLGRMDGLPLYQPFLELKMHSPDITRQMDRWEAFGYINAVRTRVLLNHERHKPMYRHWVRTQREDRDAMIALVNLRTDLQDAMFKEQYMDYDGRHWFYRPLPLLSLAAIGDERDANLLAKAFNGDLYLMPGLDVAPYLVSESRFMLSLARRDRARTYAALAIGVFLREATPPGVNLPVPLDTDRLHPRWVDSFARQMAAVVGNGYEDTAFRCATALGMGLSAHPQMRTHLLKALNDANPQAINPAVTAHGLLGLSMLRQSASDDTYILQHAKRLLDAFSGATTFTQDDLLMWRAVLLAISRIDLPDAVEPLLFASHGRHPYIDEVVVECLGQRWTAEQILPVLIAQAQNAQNTGRSFALWQIGALLDPRDPEHGSRFWTLVEDLNHTLPLLAVPAAPEVTTQTPPGPRPLGVLERMALPGYFDLMHGGAPHRAYTYR